MFAKKGAEWNGRSVTHSGEYQRRSIRKEDGETARVVSHGASLYPWRGLVIEWTSTGGALK